MLDTHALKHTTHTDRVRPYLEKWGSQSLAYSCLQPNINYFEIHNVGMIPYRKYMGTTIALGNPLCPPQHETNLLKTFLTHHPKSIFAQTEGTTVTNLRNLKLHLTPIGMDTQINIPTFTLHGKSKRDLRHYQNKTNNATIQIQEEQDTPAKRFELHQLSKIWMKNQKISNRELTFLIRPLATQPEPHTRIFTATQGSQTLAARGKSRWERHRTLFQRLIK
jgi:lysylphosphatidylglycerol synthetase-like protein (DUF2156 family)